MSPTPLQPLSPDASSFPALLKGWRRKRRLSQLDLASESGVSQRHLSFLESGRAKPSRAMILQLSETLTVPLRERNDWLLAAGFAPFFRTSALDDPQMSHVMGAVRLMLRNHEPYPAVAIDRAWNVRLCNEPFDRMLNLLCPDLWAQTGSGSRNMMRLFFHPEGLRPWVVNWRAVAPLVWHRACREAEALDGREMRALLVELSVYQEAETLWVPEVATLLPVLPLTVEKDGLRASFFTVIATFGTAQDVTTDELRIESLFPADDATEHLFPSATNA